MNSRSNNDKVRVVKRATPVKSWSLFQAVRRLKDSLIDLFTFTAPPNRRQKLARVVARRSTGRPGK
ncbi:hypothetical protein DFR29_11737 [Tahibacter aquaticus]|uniref:Uncharacterized protein n=1 Tax=Tahibacter aquaticus TaxID=520092 RepID=A0A4R6YNK0_9GAMM|nr:hypothetical protein [Tahibacter aquaticus]TDR39133.1 hypothetical protein DFR29_11737 [Tahibacter aquaticus]